MAVPQRGSWDAGLPKLGKRGNIFRKHGLDLEILYTQAGPESIQALIAGSVDIATASGVQAAFGTFGKGACLTFGGKPDAGLGVGARPSLERRMLRPAAGSWRRLAVCVQASVGRPAANIKHRPVTKRPKAIHLGSKAHLIVRGPHDKRY